MGFLNRLFRKPNKPEPETPPEEMEYEDPPEDPTLQALGGPRYALSQILFDFENFGLYELGKKPKILGSIHNAEQLERALHHVTNPPDNRSLYLAAHYEGLLVLFHR